MNSTPVRPSRIIVLMAFPPPPPTPITLILAPSESSCTFSVLLDIFNPPLLQLEKILDPSRQLRVNAFEALLPKQTRVILKLLIALISELQQTNDGRIRRP